MIQWIGPVDCCLEQRFSVGRCEQLSRHGTSCEVSRQQALLSVETMINFRRTQFQPTWGTIEDIHDRGTGAGSVKQETIATWGVSPDPSSHAPGAQGRGPPAFETHKSPDKP